MSPASPVRANLTGGVRGRQYGADILPRSFPKPSYPSVSIGTVAERCQSKAHFGAGADRGLACVARTLGRDVGGDLYIG